MLRAVANIPEYIGSFTFANLPAASSYSGYRAFCSDLGANGCDVRSNGTRWRPVNGVAVMKVFNGGGPYTNSETIATQTLVPAGFLQTGDVIRTYMSVTKSGTTDAASSTARIGTAGTTADTAIGAFSAAAIMGAANLTGGYIWDVQVVDATHVQKLGLGSGASGSYTGASGNALSSSTAISNVSNALYFSVAVLSGGTTNTVSLTNVRIEIITP